MSAGRSGIACCFFTGTGMTRGAAAKDSSDAVQRRQRAATQSSLRKEGGDNERYQTRVSGPRPRRYDEDCHSCKRSAVAGAGGRRRHWPGSRA